MSPQPAFSSESLRSAAWLLACWAMLMLAPAAPGASNLMGAQSPSQDSLVAQDDGPLRVYLLSIDRGEQVYEMFGHNALLIQNLETGEALAWNWGLFNFEDVDFIPRFLRGTMRYSMGPADVEWFLQGYAMANRAVHAHRINLTPSQSAELDAYVRWNFLPENRPYIYDYFRDNCSTRVRDALDRVLGGVLRAQFEGMDTERSYRWYARRQVQVTGWIDQGLSFLLGRRGDPSIDAWAAMFLPMELMAFLETVEITPEEAGAIPYPLLGPRETWVQSDREPLPPVPPSPSALLLLTGLAGGLLLTLGGWRTATGRRGPAVGILAGISVAWGILAGSLGLILVLAWWTDHYFIQANMNLLQTNPLVLFPALMLAAAAIWPGVARKPAGARLVQAAAKVGVLVAAISLVGALAQFLPAFGQGNMDVLFLALPLNLSLASALWMVSRRPSRFSS